MKRSLKKLSDRVGIVTARGRGSMTHRFRDPDEGAVEDIAVF